MGGISPMASERRANGQDEPFNVKYWGIGNEAWGCGGSMRAEYYADLCRQYSTYLRNYSPEHKIFKIASGANVADYHWTKTVMERAGQAVDAVSLHYYTVPHEDWQHKGSATDFTNEEYYLSLIHISAGWRSLRFSEKSIVAHPPSSSIQTATYPFAL